MRFSRRGFLGLTAARTLYLGTYGASVGIATYDTAGKLSGAGTIDGVPDP